MGDPTLSKDFAPVRTSIGGLRVNEKTVLGLVRKETPDYNVGFP